jgi:cytochrome c oxidase subunit 1
MDVAFHDTYYVVAHFHYVLSLGAVFAIFCGFYYWIGKMSGRQYPEWAGKVHFWVTFIGVNVTFFPQHFLGAQGMPRRYPDYLAADGFTALNTISTIGAFILGASMLPFLWNVWKSYRFGARVVVDDPWGFGNSLEWATTCPPPLRNFDRMPRIRSERPAFDLKYSAQLSDLARHAHQREVRRPQDLGR